MSITFPDIDPVALALGPLEIRWYALAYVVSILIGWRYALNIAARDNDVSGHGKYIQKIQIDDFITWAVIGIVLGGRLGYVLFYQLGYYLDNPESVLQVWKGGMSFHGGAAGVLVAMILFCRKRKIILLRFTDMVSAVVPIGLLLGRIANFVNAELYGRVTEVSWGVVFPFSNGLPRHPSQLYEAGLEGLLLGFVLWLLMRQKSIRDKAGVVTGLFVAGYGLSRFIVEFFREPDAHLGFILGPITMGQILSLPMILAGLLLVVYAHKKSKKSHKSKS